VPGLRVLQLERDAGVVLCRCRRIVDAQVPELSGPGLLSHFRRAIVAEIEMGLR